MIVNDHEKRDSIFRKIAVRTSEAVGTRWAFIIAVSVVLIWLVTGPYFHFSNTWQLVINTSTTVVTVLMVFLIQNTQNREAKATQIKLDEIIRAIKPARDSFIDIEDASDVRLAEIKEEFKKLREVAQEHLRIATKHQQ